MISLLSQNIFRFIGLVLLQVFILNNIQFSGYFNPFLYTLFILLLPFEIPTWFLLILSFILGVTVDVFSNTLGLHTAATVFMGFLRPYVLKVLSPRDGYEPGTLPKIGNFGLSWFLKYSIALVFAHHFMLFFLEVFGFDNFFSTIFRIIASSIFTISLIILSQYITYRK
ncbi:MAG TPA: rod shape-determining protein MreD [Bacteroidales bacterium]|nr:MAG: rod shape-determining protein MreD [Bacteroidetes bacterium GWF2_33_38]OFY76658.1 MAG: rod shape-determining protein MreD [Bacteroidetes bacterium RIFOXYA12_FULL_33_9]OFY88373.1 MAG: rod shape-determining protein MreD [Bacteroidetes bacterium RIFOXYA2_FULL_33_7]HBF88291.1 rod shape-determining protein MreD [Bacteroidales bacterium]